MGSRGARRNVAARQSEVRNREQRSLRILLPSVTTPKVPSAPIKSLVVSKPAADFLARLRVLMISPLGSTTVLGAALTKNYQGNGFEILTRLRNHSALAVPYRTAFALVMSEFSIIGLRAGPNAYFHCTQYQPCRQLSVHQTLVTIQ